MQATWPTLLRYQVNVQKIMTLQRLTSIIEVYL